MIEIIVLLQLDHPPVDVIFELGPSAEEKQNARGLAAMSSWRSD